MATASRDRLFGEYLKNADVAWVSRPHNVERILKGIIARNMETNFKIVNNAEATGPMTFGLMSRVKEFGSLAVKSDLTGLYNDARVERTGPLRMACH